MTNCSRPCARPWRRPDGTSSPGARADALTIHGEVGLAPPGNKTQRVSLKWVVAMPDGRVLGTVEQANQVPTGSLDQRLGPDRGTGHPGGLARHFRGGEKGAGVIGFRPWIEARR